MTDLPIHSLGEFAKTILGCLEIADAREIACIGADRGIVQHLAAHAQERGGRLTSIDPAPASDYLPWAAAQLGMRHLPIASLDAMPRLAGIDAWVLDGDPNYHSVSNQLKIAHHLARREGRPFLALLHEVSWPCARRDMYEAPDRIPAHARHSYSWSAGVTLDDATVVEGRGFRGVGDRAIALQEGGPRNGVLTAVEDFLTEVRADDAQLAFALVPAVFGLGVIFAADAAWTAEMASLLLPLHDHPMIARLEEDRLRSHLTLLDSAGTATRRLAA